MGLDTGVCVPKGFTVCCANVTQPSPLYHLKFSLNISTSDRPADGAPNALPFLDGDISRGWAVDFLLWG